MIKSFQLRFDTTGCYSPLKVSAARVNVFVGPNNSGKSILLREVEGLIRDGESLNRKIIHQIEFESLSDEEIRTLVLSRKVEEADNADGKVFIRTLTYPGRDAISDRLSLKEFIQTTIEGSQLTQRLLARLFTIRLDGIGRLGLVRRSPSHSIKQTPTNHLLALLRDDFARKYLQDITVEAFGLYFLIDHLEMTNVGIRMSEKSPSVALERSIDEEAISFFSRAKDIEEFSDGVKAFTGLLCALLGMQYKTMLIDEPEAFLHPPLSRMLGRRLTEIASKRNGVVFASTHSPEFLMGCIQTGCPVGVVRLTYQAERPTARLLSADELQQMMREPLLRSTGILSALFHQGAVICEGDIDRALYEEVNARLVDVGEGMNDVLFTNGIGKQTIHKIVGPLRKMGIPAAAVVDLDILKEADLAALLRSANVPETLVITWSNLKKELLNKFNGLGIDPKKGGIIALDDDSRQVAENLLANAAEYGVFIVPVGEVEKWLNYVGATGTKTKWLSSLFELMGTDRTSSSYVQVRAGDVWDFLRSISKWIGNPNRKGIPH